MRDWASRCINLRINEKRDELWIYEYAWMRIGNVWTKWEILPGMDDREDA